MSFVVNKIITDAKKYIKSLLSSPGLMPDSEYIYLGWIASIFAQATKAPGHIIEVGVASGRNSILFANLLKCWGEDNTRRYYGFDTFEGYSDDTLASNPWLSSENWKQDVCNQESVEKRLFELNLDNLCSLIKGDSRETIPDFVINYQDDYMQKGQGLFSLLYIDCNAYEPAIEAMQAVYPYLSPGGIIAIDERTQGGETKAIINFAKNNSLSISHEKGGVPIFIQKPNP